MKAHRSHRFAVLRARFNEPITHALLDGALRGFADSGVARRRVDVFEVPGSFELPVAALWLANTRKYQAIVCLGCVIRGETHHFALVAGEAARGVNEAALATGVPIAFGVLTTDTIEQAWARAGRQPAAPTGHLGEPSESNKGYEAAQSAVAMAFLRSTIR